MIKPFEVAEETTYKQEDKLRRDLLIFACAFMNLAVVLWLAIYWFMGLHFPANVPCSTSWFRSHRWGII
mgnify:CR=1 FL=1